MLRNVPSALDLLPTSNTVFAHPGHEYMALGTDFVQRFFLSVSAIGLSASTTYLAARDNLPENTERGSRK